MKADIVISQCVRGEVVEMTDGFTIRPTTKEDRNWIAQFTEERWGSTRVVSRGQVYLPHLLDGFLAVQDTKPMGLLTYQIDGDQCEIVTIDSVVDGQGIGSALIETLKQAVMIEGVKRIWLITTNDNMPALHFYQKRGFFLAALHKNALEDARKLKPEIPLYGIDGIPLRDEIELEMLL
jgi:DNA-3-methyladenine glycosylase I